MASVFKPTYLLPIPQGAERCKLHGEPAVRYTDGKGRKHVRPVHRDREGNLTDRMVSEQSQWWMKYALPDGTVRRVKGYKDRGATEQEAGRLEREAQQAAAGMLVVDPQHLATPLAGHVEAFIADLERSGRAPKHYELLDTRLRAMAAACGWETLRHIGPDSLMGYLAEQKRQGRAGKTLNEYLAAAQNFVGWCIRTRRLAGNLLAGVARIKHIEKVYVRRAMTEDEARRLLAVAGPRLLVYLTALTTGLRRKELRALEWRDVRIGPDVPTPHLALRAATTKAKRADTVPLREDVAAELLAARPAGAGPADRVFAHVPKMATFKSDLARAGIDHADGAGRVVDFHGLRVSFGTMLAKAGTAPRSTMDLMRHTDLRLTMGVYTDHRILDTARAVEQLPSFTDRPEHERQAVPALRTGTDDLPVQTANATIALNRGSDGPQRSATGRLGDSERAKTPIKSGVFDGGGGNRTRVP